MKASKRLLAGVAACAALVGVTGAQGSTLILTNFVGPGGAYHQGVDITTPAYSGQAGGFVGTWDGNPIQVWCYELGQTFNFGVAYTGYTHRHAGQRGAPECAVPGSLRDGHDQCGELRGVPARDLGNPVRRGPVAVFGNVPHQPGRQRDGPHREDWLAGLGGFTDKGDIILYHSRDHQDFIGRRPSSDVPEPAPLALLGIGLVAMLAGRRRAYQSRGIGRPSRAPDDVVDVVGDSCSLR